MTKHVSLDDDLMTGLPHGKDHLILNMDLIITYVWNKSGKMVTITVGLMEPKEVGEGIPDMSQGCSLEPAASAGTINVKQDNDTQTWVCQGTKT